MQQPPPVGAADPGAGVVVGGPLEWYPTLPIAVGACDGGWRSSIVEHSGPTDAGVVRARR